MAALTVALLQMNSDGFDQQANLTKGVELCKKGGSIGADIVLFPEMWNIGYTAYHDEVWDRHYDPCHPRYPDLLGEWKRRALHTDDEFVVRFADLGSKRLGIWASDRDLLRRELLRNRGYKRQKHESQWRRHFQSSVPNTALPPGYSIKAVGEGLELLERVYASGLGFHEGDINTAVDNRNDPSWYHNLQRAPLYRRDLDLIATASDGSICSLCTVWLDDVTRSRYVQPVATIPAHQRKGLARAVLTEACNRAWPMGATILCVAGVAIDGNSLYRSVMGPDHDRYAVWVREFASD